VQQGEVPFLRLVVPLCAGIIISDFSGHCLLPGVVCSMTAMAGMMLSYVCGDKGRSYLFGVSMFLLLTGTGYMLHQTEEKNHSTLAEKEGIYLLRLKDYPEKKAKSYSFFASIEASGEGLSLHPKGNLLVYLSADSISETLKPGDRLLVKIIPEPVVNRGNPCEFDYVRYLAGHKIRYSAFLNKEKIISHTSPPGRSVSEYSLIAARKLVESFSAAGLKGDDLGLVTALTIGEKEYLNREYLTSFSRAGVMHVMAVSGMHVGMISLFLSWILFFIKGKMTLAKTIIILIVLWSFAFITGLSPSVMRATLMFSFLQTGSIIKRPGSSLNLLLASAFILLAARPSVLFEAGFQLSYVAVLFIILFYEPFYSLVTLKNRAGDYIWQMVAVSVVAQVGTFPLVVRLFNTFPLLFLVSNIVIIPLSFLIMILAFLLVPVSGIASVSNIIVWLLSLLAHITLNFTGFISSLHYGVITGIGLTGAECLALTTASGLLLTSLLKTTSINLRPFIISMILFFISGIYSDMEESRKEGIIVYNIKGKALPAFQTGRYLTLFYTSDTLPAEVVRHACTKKLNIIKARTNGMAFKVKKGGLTFSGTSHGCFLINGRSGLLLPPGSEVERYVRFKSR
jgi:competence protein ComEC